MEIEKIEALVVAPDEVLVVKVPQPNFDWGEDNSLLTGLQKAMDEVGLAGRYIIFCGEVEFSKVKL